MIKELRLATGCGDAKARVQMEKKPDRARTERNRKRELKSEVFDLMFVYCICEKKKIHDDVVIRIRNKYNQAFNLRLRYKQQTLQYLQILSLETFRDAA